MKGFIMQKQFYFLSPVEVVKVSSQNLQEVAEWCGGKVSQTESRRVPGRMDSYVWVPTPKGSNISWAFPGMFITKRLVVTVKGELRATWAVFRRDYFEKNYFDTPEDSVNKTWELEDRSPKPKPEPVDPEKLKALMDHVNNGGSPSEPIQEPAPSTADVEEMDDETRERIEQVNRDIVSRQLKPMMDEAVKLVEEELGGQVVEVTEDAIHYVPKGTVVPPEVVVPEPTGQAVIEELPDVSKGIDGERGIDNPIEAGARGIVGRRIAAREDSVEENSNG